MYLAITLARLDDFDNACSAYEKAIEMESDHLFELNYAITLCNNGEWKPNQTNSSAPLSLLYSLLSLLSPLLSSLLSSLLSQPFSCIVIPCDLWRLPSFLIGT